MNKSQIRKKILNIRKQKEIKKFIFNFDLILNFLSNATRGTNKTSGYFTIFEIGSGIPNLFIAKGSFVDHW